MPATMHDGMSSKPSVSTSYMALLALIFLARIVAMRIDATPLFRRFSRFGYR